MDNPTVGDKVTFHCGRGEVIKTETINDGERLLHIYEPPGTIHKFPSSTGVVREI